VRRNIFRRGVDSASPTIALYDGFGADGRALIQGRVLANRMLRDSSPHHSAWENAVALIQRVDADPLPRAVVRVTVGDSSHDFHADDEGFFVGWMDAASPRRLDDDWVRLRATLAAPEETPVPAAGRALMPAVEPEFLVISDVDDTVLQSNVTSFLRAARTMLFENARTRLPFPGVAAFYQALRRGPSGHARNPMFYVSSSPWNLYDVIEEFLEIQEIPSGPLLLRDVDLGLDVLSSRQHHAHKREMIRRILTTFEAPVILLGDSGQQDPEIYRDIVRDYAGRALAVYIRNVSMNDDRTRAIQALADEVVASGASLVLADDTLAAARHAADHGYITRDSLAAIAEEKLADEGATAGKADAPGAPDHAEAPTPTVVVE
jgi:phosphatidate phosphatase APP1